MLCLVNLSGFDIDSWGLFGVEFLFVPAQLGPLLAATLFCSFLPLCSRAVGSGWIPNHNGRSKRYVPVDRGYLVPHSYRSRHERREFNRHGQFFCCRLQNSFFLAKGFAKYAQHHVNPFVSTWVRIMSEINSYALYCCACLSNDQFRIQYGPSPQRCLIVRLCLIFFFCDCFVRAS